MSEAKPTCRICLTDSGTTNDFVHPCLCRGTQHYVHRQCLTAWMQSTSNNVTLCPVCQHTYHLGQPPVYQTIMVLGQGLCCFLLPAVTSRVRVWMHNSITDAIDAASVLYREKCVAFLDEVGVVDEYTWYYGRVHLLIALRFLVVDLVSGGIAWCTTTSAFNILSRKLGLWYRSDAMLPARPDLGSCLYQALRALWWLSSTNNHEAQEIGIRIPLWSQLGIIPFNIIMSAQDRCWPFSYISFMSFAYATIRYCKNSINSYRVVLSCMCAQGTTLTKN